MTDAPLIQFPASNKAPIHVLITKPGAILGTDAQREEIAAALPKPNPGKHWQYQPMAQQPLRFATIHDGDAFMEAMGRKEATDRYFVAPMKFDEHQKKWKINPAWKNANGELVVFMQADDETPKEAAP